MQVSGAPIWKETHPYFPATARQHRGSAGAFAGW